MQMSTWITCLQLQTLVAVLMFNDATWAFTQRSVVPKCHGKTLLLFNVVKSQKSDTDYESDGALLDNEKLRVLESVVSELKQRNQRSKVEIRSLTREIEEKTGFHNAEVIELKRQIIEANSALDKEKSVLATTSDEISKCKQKHDMAIEHEKKKARGELEDRIALIYEKSEKERKRMIISHAKELEDVNQKLEELRQKNRKLDSVFASLSQDIEKKTTECKLKEERLEISKAAAEAATRRAEKLQKSLQDSEKKRKQESALRFLQQLVIEGLLREYEN